MYNSFVCRQRIRGTY